jgi:hypothetical protein
VELARAHQIERALRETAFGRAYRAFGRARRTAQRVTHRVADHLR